MNKVRRSKAEINADVLAAIAEGKEYPNSIHYRANLEWSQMKKILANLCERSLIKVEIQNDGRIRCSITPKGIQVLKEFTEGRFELVGNVEN